jgi:hypothetical protein
VANLKKLTDYYNDPWVRQRIREYCGETTTEPTCVYLSALNGDHQTWDRAPRSPVEELEKLLADDLSYTHSSALMETKADVLKGLTSGKSKYTAIEVKSTQVRQYGNTVITTHNMVFTHPTTVNKVYVSTVWVKQPSGWQMVQRQATKLPD